MFLFLLTPKVPVICPDGHSTGCYINLTNIVWMLHLVEELHNDFSKWADALQSLVHVFFFNLLLMLYIKLARGIWMICYSLFIFIRKSLNFFLKEFISPCVSLRSWNTKISSINYSKYYSFHCYSFHSIFVLRLLTAIPRSWMPYLHMGFTITLFVNNLFFNLLFVYQ